MNEDIKCPKCGNECHNADEESYQGMSYMNRNYCENCNCSFNAVYKFSHITNIETD